MNLDVKDGLQLTIMYRYRFIGCNKCITLMQDDNHREICIGVGRSVYSKSLFSVNLKLFCNIVISLAYLGRAGEGASGGFDL